MRDHNSWHFALWLCRALNPPVQMPAADLDSCQLSPSEGVAAMWLYSKLWFHIPSVCICDPLNMTVQIVTGKGNFQRQDAGKSRRQKRLKGHGREEVGRLGMKWRGREYQIWETLGKRRGRRRREELKWLESVWRAFTEQAERRKGSLSFYF